MGDDPKRMNQREFPGGLAVKDLALPVAQVTAVGWVRFLAQPFVVLNQETVLLCESWV